MLKPFLRLFATTMALVLCAASAGAAVPHTMSYQGMLANDQAQPVPDGPYDLNFALYNVPVGGSPVWTESHAGVPVVQGAFSVLLGGSNPLPGNLASTHWIGIKVGTDPELAPRIQLAASPYALGLSMPFAASASAAGPVLEVENTGAGAGLLVDGRLQLGADQPGAVDLWGVAPASKRIELSSSGSGGLVRGLDADGLENWSLAQSTGSGGGGLLRLNTYDGNFGIYASGNYSAGEPLLGVFGGARSIIFNPANPDNASVSLPANAISATETLDEPGVASVVASTTMTLTSGVEVLASRTITVPVAGYVLAIGMTQADITHTQTFISRTVFGVSKNPGLFPSNLGVNLDIAANTPNGSFAYPVTVCGTFPVNAGANTFYLIAQRLGGGCAVDEMQLNLVFIPTTYGFVTGTSAQSSDDASRLGSPLGPEEIAAEQREAESVHAQRVQRELDAMRLELDALKRFLGPRSEPTSTAATGR